ncbi:MAG TPA: hypothetical protein VJU81_06805 [Methylomirabilota bacterium]|nr:hypothetical protein [Methylomirabilota bacterium]
MLEARRSIGIAALVMVGVAGTAWAACERVHDVLASARVQHGDVDILIAPTFVPPEAPTADAGYDEVRGGLTLTRD